MNKIDQLRQNDPSVSRIDVTLQDERDLMPLADALRCNSHMRSFSLFFGCSWVELTDSDERIQALTSSIIQANLTTFGLGWRGSNKPHLYGTSLARQLLGAVQQSPTIRNLMINVWDCRALTACLRKLHSLILFEISLGPDEIQLMNHALAETATLTILHILYTPLTTDDLASLSKGLANNASVTHLSLSDCQVDDDGVKLFLQYWDQDSITRRLDFVHNRISAKGAVLLIQAASSRTAMEFLNLASNSNVGYKGLATIGLNLPQVNLETLIVDSCVSNPTNLEACKLVADVMLQGIRANTHLLRLEVSKNGLETVSPGLQSSIQFFTLRNKYNPIMLLSSSLAPTQTMQHSHLVSPTTWCYAFAKNTDNPSFIFYFIKEQPMLWQEAVSRRLGDDYEVHQTIVV